MKNVQDKYDRMKPYLDWLRSISKDEQRIFIGQFLGTERFSLDEFMEEYKKITFHDVLDKILDE